VLCPSCHHKDTKVTDSRPTNEGLAIRRRRECPRCSFRFSTVEEVEILNLSVVKRDGRREPYNRAKLESGLKKAFEKRPITAEAFSRLVHAIERDVQVAGPSEITSRTVGDIVMKHLKRVDDVAYIRFASVYRSFTDAQSFAHELTHLLGRRPTPRRPVSRKRR
jgi:transcriptional repressor NrdR